MPRNLPQLNASSNTGSPDRSACERCRRWPCCGTLRFQNAASMPMPGTRAIIAWPSPVSPIRVPFASKFGCDAHNFASTISSQCVQAWSSGCALCGLSQLKGVGGDAKCIDFHSMLTDGNSAHKRSASGRLPRDPLHDSGEAVAVGPGWAARRLFAANSTAIGKKNNAADRPSPADHRPQRVMQRVPRCCASRCVNQLLPQSHARVCQ